LFARSDRNVVLWWMAGGGLGEGGRLEWLVIGGVRRVQVEDADEAWERDIEVDDGEVRWVEADRGHPGGGWNVTVAVMELVREEPLEGVLRRRIAAALRSVEGVETVGEMDTEVWFVTGAPSGEALVRAVAEVLDDLAGQTWAHVSG
jgi:hypothetical protein